MKKGNTMIIGLVVMAIIFGVGLFVLMDKKPKVSDTTTKTAVEDQNQEQVINPSTEVPVDESGLIKTSDFGGKKLAGTMTQYLEFNKADYDKALAEERIVFLDFYANWCPICRAESPAIEAGFNELTIDKVVWFRVNYKDSETDADEKTLTEQFKIPYQNYKVILKNGQEVLKDGETWDKEHFLSEIQKTL